MSVVFDKSGRVEHIVSWKTKVLRWINRMIDEASRDPEQGVGRPERLAENLSGYWSRRITDEHRLVYAVHDDNLIIVQARYHY